MTRIVLKQEKTVTRKTREMKVLHVDVRVRRRSAKWVVTRIWSRLELHHVLQITGRVIRMTFWPFVLITAFFVAHQGRKRHYRKPIWMSITRHRPHQACMRSLRGQTIGVVEMISLQPGTNGRAGERIGSNYLERNRWLFPPFWGAFTGQVWAGLNKWASQDCVWSWKDVSQCPCRGGVFARDREDISSILQPSWRILPIMCVFRCSLRRKPCGSIYQIGFYSRCCSSCRDTLGG